MRFGGWNVNVSKNMPQKVASAMAKLQEQLIGAEYKEIEYLGSQLVNGINHAVLAEQTILSGKDTTNAVLLIFNEKPNDIDATLTEIRTIAETGDPMGGAVVDIKTDIPEDAMEVWKARFEGFVGSDISPIALLATQLVNGTNYVFLAEQSPVVPNPPKKVVLITLNNFNDEIKVNDVLLGGSPDLGLGYAFTW